MLYKQINQFSSIQRNMIKVFCLLAIILATVYAQQQYIRYDIDKQIVNRANLELNMLSSEIRLYKWIFCNKLALRNRVANVLFWLKQIRDSLPLGNIIDGQDNQVYGKSNVIIGNKNLVFGVNNWVFVSGYTSSRSGNRVIDDSILAIGKYKIELKLLEQIRYNPSSAISMIDPRKQFEDLCTANSAVSFFFQ